MNKGQDNMSNIDFLVQNSTKKILDLIRGLPDRKKIEEAFKVTSECPSECHASATRPTSASPQVKNQKTHRFTKHPRLYKVEDDFGTDDDSSASTSSVHEEVVVIKTPKSSSSRKPIAPNDDSSDEFCDVTIRSEEIDDFSNSLEERLGAYHLERLEHTPRVLKSKKTSKALALIKTDKFSGIKSYDDYKKIFKYQNRKNKHGKQKAESLSNTPIKPKSSTMSKPKLETQSARAKSLTSSRVGSRTGLFQEAGSKSSENNEGADDENFDKCLKNKKEKVKIALDFKLKTIIERSFLALKDCRSIFETGIELPDGLEDYERRKKRTVAFASRFSRNYLYQLIRNKIEIENSIHPFGKPSKIINSYGLGQRFFNAFQTIHLALDAYKKHLPTGLTNGMPPKLRELLETVIKFSDLLSSVTDVQPEQESVVDALNEYCKSMLNDPLLVNSTRESSIIMSITSKRRTPASIISQQSQKRLAMYSSTRDLSRKGGLTQPRQKYQVPSKYRTATFKHRPPPQAQLSSRENQKPRKHKMPHIEPLKLDSDSIITKPRRSQKLNVIDIDNNVSTYIQDTTADSEYEYKQGNGDGRYSTCDTLQAYAQEFFDKVTKGTQQMSVEEYNCILDHFMEITGEDKIPNGRSKPWRIQEILEHKFARSIDGLGFEGFVNNLITYANANICDNYKETITSPSGSPKKRSQTISITGPDNAKLICVKETHSNSDDSSDMLSQIQSMDPGGVLLNKLSKLSVSQHTDSNELIYKQCDDEALLTPLKLDRIPARQPRFIQKEKRHVKILPSLTKEVMLRLIEYKLQFHKDCKENFIYKKNSEFSTWIVVSRVADSIMEEILMSVARDIQVQHILEKIYAQEFK